MDSVSPYIQPGFFGPCQLLDKDLAACQGAALLDNVRIGVSEGIVTPCAERARLAIHGMVLVGVQWYSTDTLLAMCLILTSGRTAWRVEAKTPAEGLGPLPVTEMNSLHRKRGDQAGSS